MHAKGWRHTSVSVGERKVSWFRGDDEVAFAHPECWRADRQRQQIDREAAKQNAEQPAV